MPDGSASASAIARSTVENDPSERPSDRATPSRCSGSWTPLLDELAVVGPQQHAEVDVRGTASGPWSSTTRIICSGVTPLAHSAATSAPALVPT